MCFGSTHLQSKVINDHRHTVSLGHNLMLQSGIIQPSSPGIFNLMPFMQRSVDKLSSIIDTELQAVGCDKLHMSALSPKQLWQRTGRWDKFGKELITTKVAGKEFCLCPTHEEVICDIVGRYIRSLSRKHLPLKFYQITTKYRAETHPVHGLLRGREFLMKDLYTFDADTESALVTYEQVRGAYDRLFRRLDVDVVAVRAEGGNIGGELTHEYHMLADVGEDRVAVCRETGVACNAADVAGQPEDRYEFRNAIELGHTFYLGTEYSKKMKVHFDNHTPCEMGCFGLGVTRIIAASVENMAVANGLRWPKEIAPYKVCLITPREGSPLFSRATELADGLYEALDCGRIKGDVLFDDRHHKTTGWRMRHANLLGYPLVVVFGNDVDKGLVEVVTQSKGESETHKMSLQEVVDWVREYFASKSTSADLKSAAVRDVSI